MQGCHFKWCLLFRYIHSGTIPPYTEETGKARHRLTDSTTVAETDAIYCLPPPMTVCSIFIQKSKQMLLIAANLTVVSAIKFLEVLQPRRRNFQLSLII